MNNNDLEAAAGGLIRCHIDGHVHIHSAFSLKKALDNARSTMGLMRNSHSDVGFLFLTEISGVNFYDSLPEKAGEWEITQTQEEMTKLARTPDGSCIYIVAGRQVVTQEGLEVLLHGTSAAPPDGAPLAEVISAAVGQGLLVVLPWGFGKWQGTRGEVVRSLISQAPTDTGVFVADSGVRMRGAQRPALLAEAEAHGWRVLAGSDPLPLPNQERAVGRYGFVADCAIDPERPFGSMADWLRQVERSPACFGALTTPAAFIAAQVRMQLRKRFG